MKNMFEFKNFLTKDECDFIIKHTTPNLVPAEVIDFDNNSKLSHIPSQYRTNYISYFTPVTGQVDMAEKIYSKIENFYSKVTGVPIENLEQPLPILHYLDGKKSSTGKGEYYKEHHDFFHKVDDEYWLNEVLRRGGQRNWTGIIYLNDVEEGGETYYPTLDLAFKPEMGKIIFHKNCNENRPDIDAGGGLLEESLHESKPVIKGEKWALVIWSRIRKYIYNDRRNKK
tara:strand:+ start:58 stop:738 length:681 start_codon:yes stop_codon:yes gene_type:complete